MPNSAMMSVCKRIACCLVLAAANPGGIHAAERQTFTGSVAQATEPGKLPDETLSFVFFDTTLASALYTIAREAGFQAKVTSRLRGRLQNRTYSGDIASVLDTLSNEFELDWFITGNTIYASSRSERISRVISTPGYDDPAKLVRDVEAGGILHARERFPVSTDRQTVVIEAPPKYLAFVESMLSNAVRGRSDRRGMMVIKFGRKTFDNEY